MKNECLITPPAPLTLRGEGERKKLKPSKIRLEFSAGGIVFRRSAKGVEIAFIEDPWHKWTFAKGHIEKGEKIIEAAVRETSEEMGVPVQSLKVVAPLGRIDYWMRERHKGKLMSANPLIHKFVYFFLMQAPANVKFKPQAKEKIYSVKWVPLALALKILSYKDTRTALEKAAAYLNKNYASN